MSARGIGKAQPWGAGTTRRTFSLGHIAFEVNSHTTYGLTFGLRTSEWPDARPTLFSGHVHPGMTAELRALADYLDSLSHMIGADYADQA